MYVATLSIKTENDVQGLGKRKTFSPEDDSIEDDHVKEYKQHVFDNRMYIKKILNSISNRHTFSLNRMYNSIITIISTVVTIFQHLLKNEKKKKKKKQSFCFGSQKTKTFERTLAKQPSG